MTTRQIIGRGLVVAVIAALAGACAYVFSDQQERQYQATTRLLFEGQPPELRALGFSEGDDDEERAIANNVLAVGSFDVARRTAEVLGPEYDANEVARKVSVTAEQGSDVVTIRGRAPSPPEAAELVSAYRRQFTFRYQDVVRSRAQKASRAVAAALRELPRVQRRGARGDILRTQLGALAILSRTGGDPTIVEGVRATTDPVAPQTQRNTLFAALFGAVLGIGLVGLRRATASPARAASEPAATAGGA